MNKSIELILVQHALTDWNIKRKRQGHCDVPLNQEGLNSAIVLANSLKDKKIDYIISSDLKRALQTAQPLAEIKKLNILRDTRLREGRWKNQHRSSEYEVLPFDKEYEEDNDVIQRVCEFLNHVESMYIGYTVVVFTHHGFINRFIRVVESTTQLTYKGERTSLNYFIYKNKKWTIKELNDIRHVEAGH